MNITKQNNIFGYIYSIFAYFIESEIPEVKSVDLFFDQFTQQEEGNVDSQLNPRILIEINDNDITQGFGGLQFSDEFTVTLHIGIDIINGFHNKSKSLDKNLSYLDLLSTIYTKINGITSYDIPEELINDAFIINNMNRSRVKLANNTGSIKVSEVDFTFTLEDRSNKILTEVGIIDTINTIITT